MSESFAIPLSSFMKTENHLRKKRLENSPSRDTMNFGLTNQVQSLERGGKVCLSRKISQNTMIQPLCILLNRNMYKRAF